MNEHRKIDQTVATPECDRCASPCLLVDEPPPRTATSSAFWCEAHAPEQTPDGWTRTRWTDTWPGRLQARIDAHNAGLG